MACGSCGTKPGGCKSNGGCSTGSCNRMNVHDWLNNLPITDVESSCKVLEVSFKQGSRKEFFRNTSSHYFEKGDYVTLEGVGGFDVGEVSLSGELVRLQLKKRGVDEFSSEMKKVLRPSNDRDIESFKISKGREAKIQARSREIAIELKLQMKLSEIDIQADGKKATFFYTADDRVDFREMIKMFAAEFKLKVEMRQIGIRQEAAKVGGIGSCGRELCCSTWLTEFKSVNTTAARYQNLSINQTKLSGQCGRLKCCLNYELDTYLDALQQFPDNADTIETAKGNAFLIKKDIFKNLMWYIIQGGSKHYPLTITRVKEIKRLNAQGIRPEDLEPVDVTTGKPKEVEPTFVDVVGQISLQSLDKNDRRRRDDDRNARNNDRRTNEARGGNDRRSERPQPQQGAPREQRPNQPQRPPQNRGPQQPRDTNNGDTPRPPQAPREQRPNQPQRPPQNRGPQQPREGGQRPQGPRPNQRPPQNRDRGTQQPREGGDKPEEKKD
jgi:cell fate regulator YaaT (PSP1 superfamily)